MKLICSVDKNGGLGKNGGLLFHIPEDMKLFRDLTVKNAVIMGRKTFESLPGSKPLPDRINIILTRREYRKGGGAVICHDMKQLRDIASGLSCDVFVIGGAKTYRALMPLCDTAYITRVDADGRADTFMPPMGEGWEIARRSDTLTSGDLTFRFEKYIRRLARPSCLFRDINLYKGHL